MGSEICLDRNWLKEYPPAVRTALKRVAERSRDLYVAGGAVRDWLGGSAAGDLDLSVAGDGIAAARFVAAETGGALVLLDEKEGVARVVVDGLSIDIASFRDGTSNIVADLCRRDFSINAMAVAIDPATGTLLEPYTIIDPLAGAIDLEHGLIRASSVKVFRSDPLRLLRAYRFAAGLSFRIESITESWINENVELITQPAPERIRYELDAIMASDRAAATFIQMHKVGLLGLIFPELLAGAGMAQPGSHHLDVFDHNMAALAAIEKIISDPGRYFKNNREHFQEYLATPARSMTLKWAALFHDLGKTETWAIRDDGRTTFYNHDRAGAAVFTGISRRLRWGRNSSGTVKRLIELHMYPFHLSNAIRRTGITPRACLRLVKAAENDLPGLFMLAMADSLASLGPLRPVAMEEDLARLYDQVNEVYLESIKPVLSGPPLLNGNDLKELGLIPGPVFGQIIEMLEQARVAGEINDRREAIALVKDFLAAKHDEIPGLVPG